MKKYINFVLYAVLLFYSSLTLAKPLHITSYRLDVGLYTKHFSESGYYDHQGIHHHYNESNHFYAIYFNTNKSYNFAIGTAENSYRRRSYMVDIEKSFYQWHNIDLGSDFLLTTGYGHRLKFKGLPLYILPVVAPYVEFKLSKHFSIKNSFLYMDVYELQVQYTF